MLCWENPSNKKIVCFSTKTTKISSIEKTEFTNGIRRAHIKLV